jgi:hypothetical protein
MIGSIQGMSDHNIEYGERWSDEWMWTESLGMANLLAMILSIRLAVALKTGGRLPAGARFKLLTAADLFGPDVTEKTSGLTFLSAAALAGNQQLGYFFLAAGSNARHLHNSQSLRMASILHLAAINRRENFISNLMLSKRMFFWHRLQLETALRRLKSSAERMTSDIKAITTEFKPAAHGILLRWINMPVFALFHQRLTAIRNDPDANDRDVLDRCPNLLYYAVRWGLPKVVFNGVLAHQTHQDYHSELMHNLSYYKRNKSMGLSAFLGRQQQQQQERSDITEDHEVINMYRFLFFRVKDGNQQTQLSSFDKRGVGPWYDGFLALAESKKAKGEDDWKHVMDLYHDYAANSVTSAFNRKKGPFELEEALPLLVDAVDFPINQNVVVQDMLQAAASKLTSSLMFEKTASASYFEDGPRKEPMTFPGEADLPYFIHDSISPQSTDDKLYACSAQVISLDKQRSVHFEDLGQQQRQEEKDRDDLKYPRQSIPADDGERNRHHAEYDNWITCHLDAIYRTSEMAFPAHIASLYSSKLSTNSTARVIAKARKIVWQLIMMYLVHGHTMAEKADRLSQPPGKIKKEFIDQTSKFLKKLYMAARGVLRFNITSSDADETEGVGLATLALAAGNAWGFKMLLEMAQTEDNEMQLLLERHRAELLQPGSRVLHSPGILSDHPTRWVSWLNAFEIVGRTHQTFDLMRQVPRQFLGLCNPVSTTADPPAPRPPPSPESKTEEPFNVQVFAFQPQILTALLFTISNVHVPIANYQTAQHDGTSAFLFGLLFI